MYIHIHIFIFLDHEEQFRTLDEHLKTQFNKHIKPVERNGLCILQSMIEVLGAHGIKTNIEELKSRLRIEINRKIEHYEKFSSHDLDIKVELEKFLNDPVKGYVNETVDLFLPALTSAFKMKAEVFNINSSGEIWKNYVGTVNDPELESTFARTDILHIDPVVEMKIEPKLEPSRREFNCPLCYKSCAGPKRLSRHLNNCTASNNVQEDVKPLFKSNFVVVETIVVKDDESNVESNITTLPTSNTTGTSRTPSSSVYVGDESNTNTETESTLPSFDINMFDDDADLVHNVIDDIEINVSDSDHFSDDDNDDAYDDDDYVDLDLTIDDHGNRAIDQSILKKIPLQNVDKIPSDLDGTCAYSLTAASRVSLLEKCKDGRPWKKDSGSKWKGYNTVRYKNCNGSFKCPNLQCPFFVHFKTENRLKFDKNKICSLCGAQGIHTLCPARKYTAVKDLSAHVYHFGAHTCTAKIVTERQTDIVAAAIAVNPTVKPSAIQGNVILSQMRDRVPWEEIKKTITKLTDKKALSNEKLKQIKQRQPNGTPFDIVKSLKEYTDLEDKFLIANVDENKQIVFKSSKKKMDIAREMCTPGTMLSKEFCCFDGKVKRTSKFTTLTASVYHPFLQKQISLSTMECVGETTSNIELFWREFNKIYREANETGEKFDPTAWITDMASANFAGLVKIYGEEVMDKVKGCEFHFTKSVDEKSRKIGDHGCSLKSLATELLECQTKEAYEFSYNKILAFLDGNNLQDLKNWIKWWHDRREIIFRAFKVYHCPRMNQAEVIHASFVNRDEVGVSLITSTEFDVRDGMFLNSQLKFNLGTPNNSVGCGPTLVKLNERKAEREVSAAKRTGEDLLLHGVSSADQETNQQGTSTEPAKKKPREAKMFDTRKDAAVTSKDKWKIKSTTKVSELKRSYKVVTSARSYVTVNVCNVSSCSCSDFEKKKDKVWCRHIIFVVMVVMGGCDLENQLQEKFICDDDLKILFEKDIPSTFLAAKVKARTTADFKAILTTHPLYNQEQKWLFHSKTVRYATCTAYPCKKRIPVGAYCFSVNGAITVRLGESEASPQKFYFCADNHMCFKSVPPWTNIRLPTSYENEETRDKMTELGINLMV